MLLEYYSFLTFQLIILNIVFPTELKKWRKDVQTLHTVLGPKPLFPEWTLAFMLGGQKEQVGLLWCEEVQCSRDHLREKDVHNYKELSFAWHAKIAHICTHILQNL